VYALGAVLDDDMRHVALVQRVARQAGRHLHGGQGDRLRVTWRSVKGSGSCPMAPARLGPLVRKIGRDDQHEYSSSGSRFL